MSNAMTHIQTWEFPSEKNESDEVVNVHTYIDIPHTFSQMIFHLFSPYISLHSV